MPNELLILISCVLTYLALDQAWPEKKTALKVVLAVFGPITLLALLVWVIAHIMGGLDKG